VVTGAAEAGTVGRGGSAGCIEVGRESGPVLWLSKLGMSPLGPICLSGTTVALCGSSGSEVAGALRG